MLFLILGCGAGRDNAAQGWLHPACGSEAAVPGMLWETEVLGGEGFAFGLGALLHVSAEGVQHFMPPIGKVEEVHLYQGALWANNWAGDLLVCESEGWRAVELAVALGYADAAYPLLLEEGLAVVEVNSMGDGCEGDCGPRRTLHRLVDGDWESESAPVNWRVWDRTLLVRREGGWWAKESDGEVETGLGVASVVKAMPDQDWGITKTESGWTHGPRGDQTSLELPEHNGTYNGSFRRLEIIAPEHYILGDHAQGWEYKDGVWTELSFVADSRPASGVAVDGGIVMLSPLQWITPQGSVEIPLSP